MYMRARLLSELVPEVLKQGLLTVATVARLILQIECNAHTIVDKDGIGSVGLGLYLNEGAAINHSCSPNVVISFSRGVLVLRNVVDLLPKTELLIAYTDVTETTPRRQVELENNYDFQCKCKRCTIDLEASGLQRPLFINAEHVLCPGKSCTGTLFLVDGTICLVFMCVCVFLFWLMPVTKRCGHRVHPMRNDIERVRGAFQAAEGCKETGRHRASTPRRGQ